MPIGRRNLLAGMTALTTASGGLRSYAYAAAEGQTLRAALTGFSVINTLDPTKAAVNPEFYVIWGLFNTLVKLDANMKIVGDLALSWTNPDPTTWEFKLRPGVKLQHYPHAFARRLRGFRGYGHTGAATAGHFPYRI